METPTDTTTTHDKTAIILVGGGMRSAYSAGFLSALANELNITKPDIMIGSSADAGNVLYFCAGQYHSFKRVWQDLLSTPKFISVKRIFKIMDVDYLIDTVFKKQEPLDVARVNASTIDWHITVTDVDQGEVRYIRKGDALDIFEVLRAAKAIPFLYNKKILLACNRGVCRYFDGEFGATLGTHVQHAADSGATRILIIKNNIAWSWYRKLAVRLLMRTLSKRTQLLLRSDIGSAASLDSVTAKHPRLSIKMCSPDVSAGTATRSATLLKKTFEEGERDALAMETELRKLLTI